MVGATKNVEWWELPKTFSWWELPKTIKVGATSKNYPKVGATHQNYPHIGSHTCQLLEQSRIVWERAKPKAIAAHTYIIMN